MKNKLKKSIMGLALATVTVFGAVQPAKAIELDKGLSIEGTGFVDFTAVSGDSYKNQTLGTTTINGDTNTGKDNGFHFTRAYITAKDKINDDLMVRFTYDQKDGQGTASAGAGSFVKYVYGDYTYMPGQKVRFGLGQTPWIDFEESLYPYRFLGPVFSDRQGAQSSSDTGVSLIGSFMDKMLDYHVGVYEGEGYANKGDGQGFAYAGRISFNIEGFTVAVFDWTETKRAVAGQCATTGGACPDYNPTRFIGMVTYGTPMFRIAGQYLTADDNKSGQNFGNANPLGATGTNLGQGQFNKGNGYSVWTHSRIPGIDPLRVFARYDSMKPDTDYDNNNMSGLKIGNLKAGTNTMLKFGFSYDLSKTVVIALEDVIINNKIDNTGATTTDNVMGIKAQVAF